MGSSLGFGLAHVVRRTRDTVGQGVEGTANLGSCQGWWLWDLASTAHW